MDNALLFAKQSSGKNLKYTGANGRIRVLETRLMSKAFFDKLIQVDSLEKTIDMLAEHPDYRQIVENANLMSDFELILVEQLKSLYRLVDELSEDKEITNAFLFKYDLDTLRLLIKKELYVQSKEAELVELGLFNKEVLVDCIEKRNFKSLGEHVNNFLVEILEAENPIYKIEFLFDRFYLEFLKNALIATKSPFLVYAYKTIVDFSNIKVLLRSKSLDLSRDFFTGGSIESRFFYRIFDSKLPDIAKEFSNTAYFELVKLALEEEKKDSILARSDLLFDNYLIDLIREAKYFSFGIEPLICYILAKEYEVKNLRRILSGKLYRITQEQIRNNIGLAYV